MQGITIKNFKSYDKGMVFGFHPCINVLIGGNGQGKSNIFKSFAFVLSDRLQLNRTEFNNCLHRGVDASNQQDIEVEAVIRGRAQDHDHVKVAKVWKSNLNEECYVNGKIANKKEYENFVESLCLSYSNPYNIVQQGKINQIILMDEFELYKLLEEVTGAKKFNKRRDETLALMKKVESEKQETKVILHELEEKLKSLEGKKQEFEYLSIEEKTKKYRMKRHFTELLESTRHNLEKLKADFGDKSEGMSKIITKKKAIVNEIEESNIYIKTAKQKAMLLQKTVVPESTQILQTQEYKQYEKKQKEINKQIKQLSKQVREKDNLITDFRKTFDQVERRYDLLKVSKQANRSSEGKDKVIAVYEAEIKADVASVQAAQQEREKISAKIEEMQKSTKAKKSIESQRKHDQLQSQLEKCRQQIQENKKTTTQLNWQKNVISIDCQSTKELLQQAQTKLRKTLPFLDFTLIDHLRSMKVKGVYGYLLQFVKIDENVAFAYEIAAMNKLCSLLVEDEAACMAVVEANRKLKGRQINIVQLDFIRSRPVQSQAAPKAEGVSKLYNKNWVKIRVGEDQSQLADDIDKLIKNTFSKYALVKDYETGLRVSKEYHINCITKDREVVYSEGYHCKLGHEGHHSDNNLELFSKFQDKRQFYMQKLREREEIQAALMQSENEEIGLLNNLHQIQLQVGKISAVVNEFKTQRKMMEMYHKNIDQLNRNIRQMQSAIQRKKQAVKSLAKAGGKSKDKFSKEQAGKIEQEYNEKRKELNRIVTEVYEIEEQIQKLLLEKEQVEKKMANTRSHESAGAFDPHSISKQIGQQLGRKQALLLELQSELHQLEGLEKQVEQDKNHLEMKLITYRAEQEDLEARLAEIGEIQEDIDELEELSNSMSVSHLHGRKRNHFSAKDKLLFNKFSNVLESFASHKKTFNDLENAEQKIKRTITRYERDSEDYISQMAEKFEKQFHEIFTFIVNDGSTEVRAKKISEKVKDTIRYRNCLSVKVSFSRSVETMKKWNDFSGGEKTVVAISIILALQRCEPAPFYVLDEIDSALDPVYVRRIAELLARESQNNRSQYFISSFKEDMMGFPDDLCHYYMVSCENRVSAVEKIDRSRAAEAVKSLVMRR